MVQERDIGAPEPTIPPMKQLSKIARSEGMYLARISR
jgi:hypothetical protein